MQIMCKIKNNGTKNVGIKLNGNTVIAAIGTLPGRMNPTIVPTPTAVTKSKIPSACHKIKLPRCPGLLSFHATNGAVSPIRMSP